MDQNSIATLGPKQTYSERAARAWLLQSGGGASVRLYPTIRKAFGAVGVDCPRAILPIENLVDGYVQPLLDLLLHSDLVISGELLLPIQFSFVANCASLADVHKIYAQFATQGQCTDFLASLSQPHDVITTASNSASLAHVREGHTGEGAIVPRHSLDGSDFPLTLDRVNDYDHNVTRFVVVGRDVAPLLDGVAYKTTLVVVEGMDRPGMLAEILGAFSQRGVNMVSIMSRPTKESLGNYHFFIDIEGHCAATNIKEALAEVQRHNLVRLLGSYPKASQLAVV